MARDVERWIVIQREHGVACGPRWPQRRWIVIQREHGVACGPR
jgi:hypothetical protein